ncbi:MAG: efflux RND transporter periplasmic adaptor subunit [Methanomicrobiales archaeon]|nr:efflux RND transporter periplasmic adaptor subunit [Methanomicrobiales archaeon]
MVAPEEQTVIVPDTGGEASAEREAKADNIAKRIRNHPWFWKGLVFLIIVIALAGVVYWNDLQSKIYIENAQVTAPVISISPTAPGVLDELYVSVGDRVSRNQMLAKVGDEVLHAKTSGVITSVEDTPGQMVTALSPVISMIDTRKLRVIGRVQEDKGLADLYPGQQVEFTVDAFPSSQYQGVVEQVAPTARSGDIVFSISDKRQEQEFEVTVSYDVDAYPELKNGMSAKMWIFK